jgi:eukaryotic-like serine/threonine-protein kinase
MNEPNALIGRTIAGKYKIESTLGEGAMGAVYRAYQTALGREVAIKVMHNSLARDPLFSERFSREAQAASRLVHPNSILVTDFGEEPDGLLYLVMELANGRSLEKVLADEHPLGEARVVGIVSQVLAALSVAHDFGVVHRDLKPENILIVSGLDDDGRPTDIVKVCDFGIASILGSQEVAPRTEVPASSTGPMSRLTAVGTIVGTAPYMSPEQVRAATIDARSDLYSLGVVLYELLTGHLPFAATTIETMLAAHLDETPVAPNKRASISAGISDICMKALAKDPGARFPSARAMRNALRDVAGDRASVARISTRDLSASTQISSSAITEQARVNRETALSSTQPADRPSTASLGGPTKVKWGLSALGVLAASAAAFFAFRALGADRNGGAKAEVIAVETAKIGPEIRKAAPTLGSPSAEPPPTLTLALPAPSSSSIVVKGAAKPKDGTLLSVVAPPPQSDTSAAIAKVSAPEVTLTPAPTPTPTPAPAVVSAAPPAPTAKPETFSLATARVQSTVGSTSRINGSSVSPLVRRVDFTSCYRDALQKLGRKEVGSGKVHIEIDEGGVVTSSVASLPSGLGSASACVASKLQGQRLATPPDTGGASADVSLVFSVE